MNELVIKAKSPKEIREKEDTPAGLDFQNKIRRAHIKCADLEYELYVAKQRLILYNIRFKQFLGIELNEQEEHALKELTYQPEEKKDEKTI